MSGISVPAARRSYRTQRSATGFAFVVPVLVFFTVFDAFPVLYAFVVSFFRFDLFGPMAFVGLDNYVHMASDANFWSALGVTASYTLLFGPASLTLGFLLAALLKPAILAGGVLRNVFFVPTILSTVAMATAWGLLLRIDGPINAVLDLRIPWLTNQDTALVGITLLSVWQSAGWFMVVFLAGLASIPETYYEAAKIDGAGRWSALRHITLPLMRPIFALVVIQTLVAGIKVFTPMFIMTGGGPNNATRSLAMLIYHEGLRDLRMGSAGAISMVGFLVILVLTILYLRLFRVREEIGT